MNPKNACCLITTVEEIKIRIIRKLVRWRKWGAAHTENVLNGLPSHLRGEKVVKEALKQLIQDKWLIPKIKTQETHYSLNPEKAEEILHYCESHFQDNA